MSKEQIDTLMNNVEEFKKTHAQSLKDSDTLVHTKMSKLGDDITKTLEIAQKAQLAQAATDKKLEELEVAFNRPGGAGEAKKDDAFLLEQKERFTDFLKGKIEAKEVAVYQRKSMSTDVNPDGGYVVRPEFLDLVVGRIFETSPVRSVANVITTASKSVEALIDDGQATGNWVGEGAAVNTNTSTPVLGKLSITAHKLEAEPRITTELADDAYLDIEAWLAGKLGDIFSRTENIAFCGGDGVGKPKGFLSYTAGTATYVRDTVQQVNSGSSGAVTADGAIELQNELYEGFQARAVWLMARATYTDYLQLKDSNNQYLFGFDFLKNGQINPTLLGKKVVFAADMPAVAANALAVAYGDFGAGYTVVDRVGLNIQRDPFTAKGLIKFYTTKRVGGAVTDYQAIKIQKLA